MSIRLEIETAENIENELLGQRDIGRKRPEPPYNRPIQPAVDNHPFYAPSVN